MSDDGKVKVVECNSDQWEFVDSVKYGAEQDGVGRSGVELLQNGWGFDNKIGTTLASACALCLNLLSRVWLHISGGLNCCQEFRREVV